MGDLGADGSVRMFDLRHLEHSTIIYEDAQHHPLLRLCWNKQDPNYLATMAMDAMEVLVLNCFLYTRYKAGHVWTNKIMTRVIIAHCTSGRKWVLLEMTESVIKDEIMVHVLFPISHYTWGEKRVIYMYEPIYLSGKMYMYWIIYWKYYFLTKNETILLLFENHV